MAHHAGGQHWRDLGKSKSLDLPDESRDAIMISLATPKDRKVTTAHANVQSVSTDIGIKPRAHDCADCGDNAEANEAFNQAAKGPNYRPNVVEIKGE